MNAAMMHKPHARPSQKSLVAGSVNHFISSSLGCDLLNCCEVLGALFATVLLSPKFLL